MDVKDVLHAPTWDRERLGDLGQVLLDHGRHTKLVYRIEWCFYSMTHTLVFYGIIRCGDFANKHVRLSFTQHISLAGGRLSKDVIGEICPEIADYSSSVSNLILYLYRRRAISDDDFFKLKEPSATGNHLCFSLVALSQKTHGEGKHIIRNLYLALLDAFLHKGDKWCHFVAFQLRQIGKFQQQFYAVPVYYYTVFHS